MFISKKKHNRIIENWKSIAEKEAVKNSELRNEIREARDLKSLLSLLSKNDYLICGDGMSINYVGGEGTLNLGENVPIYVPDYFGGKVIKQEATKVIHITNEGEVKTGLTKKPVDKGFKYLLQRD